MIRLYFFLTICCLTLWSCNKGATDISSPDNSNVEVYQGGVYIYCESGPYRFTLDSLIANCSTTDTFSLSTLGTWSPGTSCFYDSNPKLATSDTNYDFIYESALPTFTRSDVEVTLIPHIIVGADKISTDKHPYMSAYQAKWENNTLKLYYFNTRIAGCLYNMITWKLERSE